MIVKYLSKGNKFVLLAAIAGLELKIYVNREITGRIL